MKNPITKLQVFILSLICICLSILTGILVAEFSQLQKRPPLSAAMVLHTPTHTATAILTSTPIPEATTEPTKETLPTWTPTFTPTPTPIPTATPTKTPTPTIIPTPLPPHRPTAEAIIALPTLHPSATVGIPTAVPRYNIPEDAVTIAVLGSDKRPDWSHWNTDVIQYVVIYPDVPSVSILSVPRDLYVYVPNYWMMRVNVADMYGALNAHEGGGPGLLNQTLLYNLGITADYYAKVNFDGLIGFVDTLGGIDIPVHCYLEDYWPYPDENGEYQRFTLAPGIHHLDGRQALWYSRSRKTTSVFSRERRQQQVLEAMWRKAKDTNLLQAAPSLAQEFSDLYQTDLEMGKIVELALVASQLNSANVRTYNIGSRQVTYHTTHQGGSVFLPNSEEIAKVVDSALTKPSSNRSTQNPIFVEVWNGTAHPNWDQLAADRMSHYGIVPLIGTPDRQDYAQTQIIFFAETTKGSGLTTIQSLLNVANGNVFYPEEIRVDIKMRIIIGEDYVTCPY